MTRLANVPTLVLIGPSGAGKAALIARLLEARPHGETWAVLASDRGAVPIGPCDGVAVAEIGSGCVCCTAQVALRVALAGLLRAAHPARLFVALDPASHAGEALKTLRNPWLAPVIAIDAVVGVYCNGEHPSAAAVPPDLAWCDIVCVYGDAAAFAPLAAGRRVLEASRATLAALQGVSVSEPR